MIINIILSAITLILFGILWVLESVLAEVKKR